MKTRPMSYDAFHRLIDPHDTEPCHGLFGPERVTWPRYSVQPSRDIYDETWIYDHRKGVAFRGSVGSLIEAEPELSQP